MTVVTVTAEVTIEVSVSDVVVSIVKTVVVVVSKVSVVVKLSVLTTVLVDSGTRCDMVLASGDKRLEINRTLGHKITTRRATG